MHASLAVSSTLARLAVAIFCLGASIRGAFADVVLDWNAAMTNYVAAFPPPPPFPFPALPPMPVARSFAMAHVAMLNAIDEAKGSHSHPWKNRGPGSLEAAAAQAAHDVLVHEFPGASASFDALLTSELAAIANGAPKSQGIAIGADAAADMLASRANDGSAAPPTPYVPGTNPGDYQFTSPFNGDPIGPFVDNVPWGSVTPFVIKSPLDFRPPPPYKVTDLAYTFDLNEVKALGARDSLERTPEQTAVALFWFELPTVTWNRIASLIVAQHPGNLWSNARLFATLNAAIFDAGVACVDTKFHYNFWRPVTAIHLADTDGNPATAGDPTWEPLAITPPVPDYDSGHSAVGAVASTVLIAFFGDEQTFTIRSTIEPLYPTVFPSDGSGNPVGRTFTRISDASKENSISRMLVGIHFRLACEVGYQQGVEVGMYVLKHAPYGNGQ